MVYGYNCILTFNSILTFDIEFIITEIIITLFAYIFHFIQILFELDIVTSSSIEIKKKIKKRRSSSNLDSFKKKSSNLG